LSARRRRRSRGPVLDAGVVKLIRQLASRGRGIKEIAREVGVARKAVRRYLRQPIEPGVQHRPTSQAITDPWRSEFEKLYAHCLGKPADIHCGLIALGLRVSRRTVERRVLEHRSSRSSQWELELAQAIAQRMRTTDHDELESALTDHLAKLRLRKHAASNWRA
jgi:predicted transcriptional regulator